MKLPFFRVLRNLVSSLKMEKLSNFEKQQKKRCLPFISLKFFSTLYKTQKKNFKAIEALGPHL